MCVRVYVLYESLNKHLSYDRYVIYIGTKTIKFFSIFYWIESQLMAFIN